MDLTAENPLTTKLESIALLEALSEGDERRAADIVVSMEFPMMVAVEIGALLISYLSETGESPVKFMEDYRRVIHAKYLTGEAK